VTTAPTLPTVSAEQVNPLRHGLQIERTPEPCIMIIAGATGDLSHRKLMPSIFNLAQSRLLPGGFTVVGMARTKMSDDAFRDSVKASLKEQGYDTTTPVWESFANGLYYFDADYQDAQRWADLGEKLKTLDEARGTGGNHLFYLAVPPSAFPTIVQGIASSNLGRDANDPLQGLSPTEAHGWVRIIIEKPFGRDLTSARALQREVTNAFREDQVYRIDHYLGKETVQNMLVFRFANLLFEPVWNRRYVDHVQITVAESLGLEGRGAYYEEAGALRDMIQSHVMQVLSIAAMEPPATFKANEVRDETAKVMRAIRPFTPDTIPANAVRGQYGKGWIGGQRVPGYREEEGCKPDSNTETYAAMKFLIDNWRWAGVPFYVRSGKRLARRLSEVAIQFRELPHLLFEQGPTDRVEVNSLVLRIQPDEGISMRFEAKLPGPQMSLRPVRMDFRYGTSFGSQGVDGYQRLILDCMLGDASLFPRYDWVDASWTLFMPILDTWSQTRPGNFPNYEAGTWGPAESAALLERDGHRWRRI